MTDAPQSGNAAAPGRGRWTVLLIAAVCLAPIVASYTIYYLFPREATANYGTLLATPAPAIEGTTTDGAPFALAGLRGRWVLLTESAGACDPTCERELYATRQARTMQGKEQERVARVLLIAGDVPPPADLVARHPGLTVARVGPAALASLPGGPFGIYIVDPLGNLVLRFPRDPDIKRLAGDLARLLRASAIG